MTLAWLLATLAVTAAQEEWEMPADWSMIGAWSGEVTEQGPPVRRYGIQVSFAADAEGQPVGTVRYDTLGCSGTWTPVSSFSTSWRFRETITRDPDRRCEAVMEVETSPVGNGSTVSVQWTLPGSHDPVAQAAIRRR